MIDMEFKPCKSDPYVWYRPKGNKYEYVAIYVDDLLIVSDEPAKFISILKEKYKLKIKGDGKLEYHLGCDYFDDPDGTLVSQPKKYIEKVIESYKRMFPDETLQKIKTP